MKDDFYYDGPDDEIIDEDRIGKTPNDDALLSFIFGVVSIVLVIFMRSGILAIIFGAIAWTRGNKAMSVDRKNSAAQVGKTLGLIGIILGTIFFVTCISCVSCLGCRGYGYRPMNDMMRQFRGSWRF